MKNLIRKILKEEINKKYSKPTENVDRLVYSWLDDYFEGAKIYKEESWKYYSFIFKFCKNGREIADLRVIFDDKSPNFGPRDKRPTNERSIEEIKVYIYPVMVNELVSDIPIRKNYLFYLIEEWFEDTKLDEIQKEFNRNDFSLDYVRVYDSSKGELCVPPVTKPEGVTTQDMMDHIKKNTLYSYKQMEEKEEEEPGWVEDTYLGILQRKERERVNQEDREDNEY